MAKGKTPGLMRRAKADGTMTYYWIAIRASRKAKDYPLKTRRIWATDEAEVATQCQLLTAELKQWLSESAPFVQPFDGTMSALVKCYQVDEFSPYRSVRENTRVTYDHELRVLHRTVGARRISSLHRSDFARWHREFSAPTEASKGLPRIRNAHGMMTMVRMLLKFGASMEHAGCRRALDIISLMEFKHPAARRVTMTYEQAAMIVDQALAVGRRSIALAQALQFELALRQTDVIGLWTRETVTGISFGQRYWSKGVTWGDLANRTILPKETSKTGQLGEWDLSRYPLIVKVLATIPAAERVGPMIVDERTGLPYFTGHFTRVWREIADATGLPKEIWNRDSRSGGLTEGGAAGAEPSDLQALGTHTDYRSTKKYIRSALDATNRVADLRVARRKHEQSGE